MALPLSPYIPSSSGNQLAQRADEESELNVIFQTNYFLPWPFLLEITSKCLTAFSFPVPLILDFFLNDLEA